MEPAGTAGTAGTAAAAPPSWSLSGRLQITTPPTFSHVAHQVNHDNSSSTSRVHDSASPATASATPLTASSSFASSFSSSSSPRRKSLSVLTRLKSYTQQHILHRESGSHNAGPGPENCKSPTASYSPLTRFDSSHSGIASPSERASPSRVSTPAATSTPVTVSATASAASIPPSHPETQPAIRSLSQPHPPTVPRPTESISATQAPIFPALLDADTDSDSYTTTHPATPTTQPPTTTLEPLIRHTTAPEPSAAGPSDNTMTRTRSATESSMGQSNGTSPEVLPSIRFSTFYDPRATRPSLTFTPIARTLPTGTEVIRVGRYSERDNQPNNAPNNTPSAAPVGFKSKVVSRRHCEFWYEAGKWYIKDVKSSSGTFLNHIRLSPPGTESPPYAINDGDIIQLGIDFKGGEDMIFRCVKMRLELNRGWQNKLNTFNMSTHKRLRNMTKSGGSDTANSTQSSQDCSICLNTIAPCQCLFVAPCSHTWHFKCVRSLLNAPSYPIFICPNCRAAADLEAEVEDPEEWEKMDSEGVPDDEDDSHLKTDADTSALDDPTTAAQDAPVAGPPLTRTFSANAMDLDHEPHPSTSHATSNPVPIPASVSATAASSSNIAAQARTPPAPGAMPPPKQGQGPQADVTTLTPSHEGPITPRNDAGPWVFDGSGVRTRSGAGGRTSGESGRMRSLDRAAAELAQVTST